MQIFKSIISATLTCNLYSCHMVYILSTTTFGIHIDWSQILILFRNIIWACFDVAVTWIWDFKIFNFDISSSNVYWRKIFPKCWICGALTKSCPYFISSCMSKITMTISLDFLTLTWLCNREPLLLTPLSLWVDLVEHHLSTMWLFCPRALG